MPGEEFHPDNHHEGEAHQEQPAEQVGEVAVGGSTDAQREPYPIEHNVLDYKENMNAAVGKDVSVDPETGQPRPRDEEPESRVKDEDLAQDMANASDANHTYARYYRGTSKTIPEKYGGNVHASFSENQNRAARWHEERAAVVEEWVRILHEHPPTEAFKQAYPEIPFTAEGLEYFENSLDWDKKTTIEGIQAKLEDMARDDYETEILPQQLLYIVAPLEKSGNVKFFEGNISRQELAELLQKPSMRPSELKDLMKARAEEALAAEQERVDRVEKAIEDIRSGKAAEYTGESEESSHTEGES